MISAPDTDINPLSAVICQTLVQNTSINGENSFEAQKGRILPQGRSQGLISAIFTSRLSLVLETDGDSLRL